jgi:hypothetical protein
LNSLFRRDDLAPTLFDARLAPKPVYVAVRDALAEQRGAPHDSPAIAPVQSGRMGRALGSETFSR